MRRYLLVLLAAALVAACGKSPEKASEPPKPAATPAPAMAPAPAPSPAPTAPAPSADTAKSESMTPSATSGGPSEPKKDEVKK